MKEFIKYIGIAFFTVTTSCLDVVDFDPTDRYVSDMGFQSNSNVELYLNSFYPIMHEYGQFGSRTLGSDGSLSDGLTDILKYGAIVAGAGTANLISTQENYVTVSNNHFDVWSSGYVWLRKIAEFMDGLEKNREKFGADADRYEAEARFFRAYVSFLIMRNHASINDDLGMIIRPKISDFDAKNKALARSSIEDSWSYIQEDLDFCVQSGHLPSKTEARGRVSHYAAQALKARAMLYAQRYDVAKEAALAVYNARNEFGFIADYAQIFKTLSNKEVVFGVEYKINSLIHGFDTQFAPAGDVVSKGGYAGPSQEFVDMFDLSDGTPFNIMDNSNIRFVTNGNVEMRDPRLKASVLYNGSIWKGRVIECYKKTDGTFSVDMDDFPYGKVNTPGNTITGYYMRKLLDETNVNFVTDGSFQPWPEFRYAELVLILAECYAKEGDWMNSKKMLAELRQARFGRLDVKIPEYNNWDQALDVILKERCVELGFEGHRFWDLRRTGKAQKFLDGTRYNGVLWTQQPNGSFQPMLHTIEMGSRLFPNRFYYFPIPDSEIRNNTLSKQNSNW